MDSSVILQFAGVSTATAVAAAQITSSPEDVLSTIKRTCAELMPAQSDRLLGADSTQQTKVHQWLSFAACLHSSEEQDAAATIAIKLSALNNNLLSHSFLCGSLPTVADFAVFYQLLDQRIQQLLSADLHSAIYRWCHQMQHKALINCQAHPAATAIAGSRSFVQNRATPIPVLSLSVATAAATTATASTENTNKANDAPVVPTAVTKQDKKEKKANKQADEGAATTSASAAAEAGGGSSSSSVLDPSKLDIRVGLVVKCWEHPESDKLLCEEIDLGEDAPRSIASGLRAFYAAAQVQGRRVLVLANLKERPMAGFKSQGMVLCACNADHSAVQLLEPPADAAVGDRVTFAGFSGEAATPAQMAKKKLLEALAPQLRTDEKGIACWGSVPFTVGAAGGVCTAPLKDATVS